MDFGETQLLTARKIINCVFSQKHREARPGLFPLCGSSAGSFAGWRPLVCQMLFTFTVWMADLHTRRSWSWASIIASHRYRQKWPDGDPWCAPSFNSWNAPHPWKQMQKQLEGKWSKSAFNKCFLILKHWPLSDHGDRCVANLTG